MLTPDPAVMREPVQAEPSYRFALHDLLFLSFVAILSPILNVRGLGFYTDDWHFMELFSNSPDQSFSGLFRAISYDPTRPVGIFYYTGLFRLFGPHPLGYHLVNAAALIATILVFYLALYKLGLPRLITLAMPLVFAVLPHYSTDRFWLGGFQGNLSMGLYFLSLYANLNSLQARPERSWIWGLLGIFSLLSSILIYEVAVPLFFFNILLLWIFAAMRRAALPSIKSRLIRLSISNLVTLIALIVFKVVTSARIAMGDPRGRLAHMCKGVASVFYGIDGYGLGLPRMLLRVLRYYPNRLVILAGVGVGLLAFGYFYYVTGRMKTWPGRTSWLMLVALGVVVLVLGYAIFVTSPVGFSKTGMVNRTAIAATVGMSMQFVGGLGLVSTFPRSNLLQRISFCTLIAFLCTSGFIITNTIGRFWIEANRQQHEILADIQTHVPSLPAGSTLILDGICPYVGPGIVFECHWDLGAVLEMSYKDRSLRGDVVTPRLSIGEKDLSSYIYGHNGGYDPGDRRTFLSFCCPTYPYNEKLFLYNFRQKKIYRLTHAESAHRYFDSFNPTRNASCEAYEGVGSWVF